MKRLPQLRIHIVGGPGSGKSTIGSALAHRTGTAVLDLDDVALSEGVHGDRRPRRALEARMRVVREFAAGSSWVSGGTFLWWTRDLFEQADVIIWLDPPWRLAARRIVSRHMLTYLEEVWSSRGLSARLRALRYPHLRFLVPFLRWSKHYYTSIGGPGAGDDPDDVQALTRAATIAYLAAYRDKVARIQISELDRVLEALAAQDQRAPVGRPPADPFTAGSPVP